ncbi:MAG: tetratricopeptide repeat protein [Dongiaceae bacterium]
MPRRIVGMAAAAAALALAACNGTPEAPVHEQSLMELGADAEHLTLAQAEADFAAGRYVGARDKYGRLVTGYPQDNLAKLGLAESLLALGEYNGALETFHAVADDPAHRAAALQGEGLALLAMGQVDAAGPLLADSIKADPASWRSWNGLGQYYDRKRQWADAGASYEHALASAGGSTAIVLNNQGMSLMMQKRYPEAADRFAAALQARPDLAMARGNLRLALAWQGRYDEAIGNVSQAAAADVLNNVGYVAMLRGDYREAQILLLRATEASPSYNKTAWDNLRMLEAMNRKPGTVSVLTGPRQALSVAEPASP